MPSAVAGLIVPSLKNRANPSAFGSRDDFAADGGVMLHRVEENEVNMKKIIFTAIGTRGDVRPVIQLSKYIRDNYSITVIAPPENEKEVKENGLGFLPIGEKYSTIIERNDLKYYQKQIELQFDLYHENYKAADIIVGASLFFAGRTISELYKKPYYHIFYSPQVIPQKELPPPGAKEITENKLRNMMLWKKHYIETNVIYKGSINKKRKEYNMSNHSCPK